MSLTLAELDEADKVLAEIEQSRRDALIGSGVVWFVAGVVAYGMWIASQHIPTLAVDERHHDLFVLAIVSVFMSIKSFVGLRKAKGEVLLARLARAYVDEQRTREEVVSRLAVK